MATTNGRKPYRKPTRREHDDRVWRCRQWLGAGYSAGQIKRLAAEAFDIVPRTAEGYLSRARKQMREETGEDRQDQLAEAIETYRNILTGPEASHGDRIKARTRMDKILGLDAPQKVENVGMKSEEELRREAKILGVEFPHWELPGTDPSNTTEERDDEG